MRGQALPKQALVRSSKVTRGAVEVGSARRPTASTLTASSRLLDVDDDVTSVVVLLLDATATEWRRWSV